MKTAGLAGRRPPRAVLCLLVVVLVGIFPLCLAYSAPQAAETPVPAGATNSAYLEFDVAAQPLVVWGLSLTREPKAFQKEPDTGGRKVCRGSFTFGTPAEQPTAFLWDYTKGKLWLDLNHNRDLTDDPEGALSCPVSRLNYFYQSFPNVRFKVKSSRGNYPVCLDLNLYNPEGPYLSGNAGFRSRWVGKVVLGGQEYQVGRADAAPNQFGMDNQGSLLLRPWDQRQLSWDLMNGSLDAFPYSQNLFFGGQAYRVDCTFLEQDGTGKFKIVFREKAVELGDVNLAGKLIERLVLAGRPQQNNQNQTVFTTVLDRPGPVVKIPLGAYGQVQVSLKAGGMSAHNEARYGGAAPVVHVVANAATPPTLNVGGPLTNSISAQTQGRRLAMSYQLLGAGGALYQMNGQDRSHPPGFVIYKKGKAIHRGQFEFG